MSQTRYNPAVNPNIAGFFYQNLINYDNTSPYLLDLNRNWSQVWSLLNGITFGQSRGFRDKDGIYNRPLRKRSYPKAIIQTATQVGANLLITFSDPNYTGFQTKHSVRDNSMNDARIIDADTPGQVLIEPGMTTTVLTAGTHFKAGSDIMGFYDISGNYKSAGKETIYPTSIVQQDYVSVQRASCDVARREMFNTHAGEDGFVDLWSENEQYMIAQAMEEYGMKCMFSEPGVKQSVIEGVINGTRGVRSSILTNGAAQNISTVGLTWASLLALVDSVVALDGRADQDILVMIGRQALARLQNEKAIYVQYAGVNNTIGGKSVVGINFDVWAVAGVKIKLMLAPWLSDPRVPYWMNESAWVMDLNPIQGKDMQGNVVYESPLIKIHYGDDDEEKIYKAVPGMVGNTPAMKGNWFESYDIAANSIDSCKFEMLMDNGVSYIADRSAIFEYRQGN